jgi:CO dehydrogenase maturation factor
MKIVVAGKGGAGKTTIAGTVARVLARNGQQVVGVDCDANPMLGISLGLGPDETDRLVAARQALDEGLIEHQPTAERVVETFGADAPDGVRLVVVSRIDDPDPSCPCCGLSPENLVEELETEGRTVVGDLEAGLGTLQRISPGQLDLVLVVANPTAKAIEVARRAAEIAERKGRLLVVANRVRSEADLAAIRDGLPGHELVVVPEDEQIAAADREGRSPIDMGGNGAGVRALIELAGRVAAA